MATQGYWRTSATRTRAATPDLAISPCWVKTLTVGTNTVYVSGVSETWLSVYLQVSKNVWDILEGDGITIATVSYTARSKARFGAMDIWFLQRS